MAVYLERFRLPVEQEDDIIDAIAAYNGGATKYIDNPYPCRVFPGMELTEISFRPITILYGGNGSGKSTLLNLIAQKAALKRIAPHNSGETFELYAEKCEMSLGFDDEGAALRIPDNSRFISSDDIFDYMLTLRTDNDDITANKKKVREEYAELKYGQTILLNGLQDHERLRRQVEARSRSISRRQFIRRYAGSEAELFSNGETALRYFEQCLKNDTLYCLDEPENSMSPAMQLKLVDLLQELVRWCGCQLIIATHSPFLLAMQGARIYDLDSRPVCIKNWWELENTRLYFSFFNQYRHLFEDP